MLTDTLAVGKGDTHMIAGQSALTKAGGPATAPGMEAGAIRVAGRHLACIPSGSRDAG